jgi:hypothetical protein
VNIVRGCLKLSPAAEIRPSVFPLKPPFQGILMEFLAGSGSFDPALQTAGNPLVLSFLTRLVHENYLLLPAALLVILRAALREVQTRSGREVNEIF